MRCILNTNEDIVQINYSYSDFGNQRISDVTLNETKLLDLLNNARNDRSAEIQKLIIKLTESDKNSGDQSDKTVNDDFSDVDDYYFEYAKSEYADRYFFYFSRLSDLSEDVDHSSEKEFNEYNCEKTNEIERQLKLCENDIKNTNNSQQFQSKIMQEVKNKNEEQQKILGHPLTEFYKNEAQIKKIKKEINDIKKDWKRQYYKFIFAYMLERPDEIYKLRNVIENLGKDVQFKFIEFLLKHTDHQNFAYACYKFDDLLKIRDWLFKKKDQLTKNELKIKYETEIKKLNPSTIHVVNSLLSNDKETFLERHMYRSWVGLGWTFGILITVIIAPIPIQLIVLPFIFPTILGILFTLTLISGLCLFDFGKTIMQSLMKAFNFCWSNTITAGAIYSSTAFAAIFWIAIVAFVIAVIFWAYKGYMHNRFEKSLKRSPEEKDFILELSRDMPKENNKFSDLNNNKDNNNCPRFSNSNSNMKMSINDDDQSL